MPLGRSFMSFTITVEHLAAIAGRTTPLMPGLVECLNRLCPLYEIDLSQEYCHFLAQACHETDHFKTLREYAVWSACEYWKTRGLNDIANHADSDVLKKKYKGAVLDLSPVEYISYRVNGGNRGLDERKKFYSIAQRVLVEPAVSRLVRGKASVRKRTKKRTPSAKRTSTRSARKLRKTLSASRAKPVRAAHRKR
jgi:predicted chitinase